MKFEGLKRLIDRIALTGPWGRAVRERLPETPEVALGEEEVMAVGCQRVSLFPGLRTGFTQHFTGTDGPTDLGKGMGN